MLEGGVHDFVGQHAYQLVGRQLLYKGWIVEEALAVSRHGGDAWGRDRREPENECTEEGVVQEQDGPGLPDAVKSSGFCDLKHKLSSL
jgi:hypothetical protein